MLMPVRDRGDASAHACIHLRSEDDLAAGVMDAHLLPVGDSMGGRCIRMQEEVARLAQKAERRVDLAPRAPRAVAKRLRLPERRLVGAAHFVPLSEQFWRRQPPSADPLEMLVHPGSRELQRHFYIALGLEFLEAATRTLHQPREHELVCARLAVIVGYIVGD